MNAEINVNKLIKQAAGPILKSGGLFQKGLSRIWIDDNGWYLIIVEFQPSSWEKGSYLNVAVHFLWDIKEVLSFDHGSRVGNFVRFDGSEEAILADIQMLADTAMKKVAEYRRFQDLSYARKAVLQNKAPNIIHSLYQKMMICGLCRDPRAVKFFKELLNVLRSSDAEWAKAYYEEAVQEIAPIVEDAEQLFFYICKKIEHQRNYWRSRPSMKKLDKQCIF